MNKLQHDMIEPPLSVSICIPVFNGADYLQSCLDSIRAQTYGNFEIVLVDDKSTDCSLKIAEDYARKDARLKVFCNERNLGLVENWNRCVELASGQWVKFLFQDDILEANCLERMLAVCGPNTSMVVCKRNIIVEDDAKGFQDGFLQFVEKYNIDTVFKGETEISPEIFCKAVLDNWLWNFVGEPTAVMLHRSVFTRFGLFSPHLIQICDFEYWIRVASNTGLVLRS